VIDSSVNEVPYAEPEVVENNDKKEDDIQIIDTTEKKEEN
jgi:hypothetical protein